GNVWAAGHTPCHGFAVWNGTSFEQLPSPGNPQLLTVWNDQIVVATQISTGKWPILRFNGTTWDTLGVPNNFPMVLGTFAGKLVVGGRFTTMNGIGANRIAAFDGSTWTPFGAGFTGANDEVDFVTEYAGKLVAAGSILGGKKIGVWNEGLAAWEVPGQGL